MQGVITRYDNEDKMIRLSFAVSRGIMNGRHLSTIVILQLFLCSKDNSRNQHMTRHSVETCNRLPLTALRVSCFHGRSVRPIRARAAEPRAAGGTREDGGGRAAARQGDGLGGLLRPAAWAKRFVGEMGGWRVLGVGKPTCLLWGFTGNYWVTRGSPTF